MDIPCAYDRIYPRALLLKDHRCSRFNFCNCSHCVCDLCKRASSHCNRDRCDRSLAACPTQRELPSDHQGNREQDPLAVTLFSIECLLNKSPLRLIPHSYAVGTYKNGFISRFYRFADFIHCVFSTEYPYTRWKGARIFAAKPQKSLHLNNA